MRFIHLSDVRLGRNTESGKNWGRERTLEISETLRRTVAEASARACELMLISGELFSHQPVTAELEEVNRMFLSVPSTEIVIAAGKSDMVRRESPVQSFAWAPNVHFARSGAFTEVELPKLNASVFVRSVTDEAHLEEAGNAQSLCERMKAAAHTVRLAAFWESDEEAARAALSGCALSYAALGGKERQTELLPNCAYYSGGLEPYGMSDTGEHGFYIGDISNATGALIKLTFVPFAAAAYIPLVIRVNESITAPELTELVKKEIEKRGASNIYRLRLAGKKDPDVQFDLSEIEERYRIADLIDETEPQYDFAALFAEHPQDMIGYYISTLRKNEEELSEIERKAMFYGIHALLQTEDTEKKR